MSMQSVLTKLCTSQENAFNLVYFLKAFLSELKKKKELNLKHRNEQGGPLKQGLEMNKTLNVQTIKCTKRHQYFIAVMKNCAN